MTEGVPDGEIEVTMTCPVCRTERDEFIDCEMLGPDGWECPHCRTTWSLDGQHGERHRPTCWRCGSEIDPEEMPPPECSKAEDEGVYCSPTPPEVTVTLPYRPRAFVDLPLPPTVEP